MSVCVERLYVKSTLETSVTHSLRAASPSVDRARRSLHLHPVGGLMLALSISALALVGPFATPHRHVRHAAASLSLGEDKCPKLQKPRQSPDSMTIDFAMG